MQTGAVLLIWQESGGLMYVMIIIAHWTTGVNMMSSSTLYRKLRFCGQGSICSPTMIPINSKIRGGGYRKIGKNPELSLHAQSTRKTRPPRSLGKKVIISFWTFYDLSNILHETLRNWRSIIVLPTSKRGFEWKQWYPTCSVLFLSEKSYFCLSQRATTVIIPIIGYQQMCIWSW